MLLPPKTDGTTVTLDSLSAPVLIIGANGAGKSRFTAWLINTLRGRSVRISAHEAIYDTRSHETLPGSIDESFEEMRIPNIDKSTRFERMMSVLLHREMVNLIAWKMKHAQNPKLRLRRTPLDDVIDLWQETFPGNQILVEEGRLLFRRESTDDTYSSRRLSEGEKAVLYYIGAVVLAPPRAVIFVDHPAAMLHSSVAKRMWASLEARRSDCRFVYTTHDLDFAASLSGATTIWVKDFDPAKGAWDYDLLPTAERIPDEVYLSIIGSRRLVLFIEGDDIHSIDAKLYPYIFPGCTVKALGSCNKVIEAVRSFNDLKSFHHLDSYGIVDRDRRDPGEVEYLKGKKIMVPGVAEVENLLMLEEVVRTVASHNRRNEDRVAAKVKKTVIEAFSHDLRQQALEHTRHRMKRTLEYRIDGRFHNIDSLESHLHDIVDAINPRGLYESLCRDFHQYVARNDYPAILAVYNRKSMISSSNVAALCAVEGGKQGYVRAVITILRSGGDEARRIRHAVRRCFGITEIP